MAAATIAVRAWFILAHRIDSDEPQHLHVAWAWTQGLVQYRDVFDNHLPLLHVLFAPVLALVPESSAVFVLMRLAVAPIAIGCAWLVFTLARPSIGLHRAAAAALLFSGMPPWLSKSVEFRNDTLWIFCWLAALVLIARRRGPSFFLAGIASGLCLLASIKTVPLLLAHALALLTLRSVPRLRDLLRFAAGATMPVLFVILWMHAAGALDTMVYDTLLFNAAAPVSSARRIGGAITFVFVAAAIVLAGRQTASRSLSSHLNYFAIWYVSLLLAFWPILTSRDFLPLVPVAALIIATALPRTNWRTALAAAMLAATFGAIVEARIWRKSDRSREAFVDAAVRLTAPGDYVFDLKGDAVFRRRPVPLIYEDVGRALTANGTIADRGPEQIAADGCCAAVRDSSHLPPRTRAFLNRYFLDDGAPLRVCGTDVRGGTFEVAVPQTYAVLAADPARVVIDGIPYRGPRDLRAGLHSVTSGGNSRVRVIWWRAAYPAKEWL
jgi:hypothetical protein